MNIGIVTTWFERGAAYVSKLYLHILEKEGHNVYIFARGGENHDSQYSAKWNQKNVTRSTRYINSKIEKKKFVKWLENNKIEALLFNEQRDYSILLYLKQRFSNIKLGAYVDYYTEDTLQYFDFYDFLICNTHRHMQAMDKHSQKYYVPWGTDLDLYKPDDVKREMITFFHSVGMSTRKGTDLLIDAYIEGKCYNKSRLVIHTQIPIEKVCKYNKEQLKKYGIEIIAKTVPPPGLYHRGDVYVYPTRLDGLGLTMYEALASGLPMIVPDFPPMNEIGDISCVRRVKIKDYYCRSDAYYYPMVICDKNSLIDAMNWFITHENMVESMKCAARNYAVHNCNIYKQSKAVSDIFIQSRQREIDGNILKNYKKRRKNSNIVKAFLNIRKIYQFYKTFV